MIADAGIDVRTAVRKREAAVRRTRPWPTRPTTNCSTRWPNIPILIERPFVITPKGTRLARPIDAVREIL